MKEVLATVIFAQAMIIAGLALFVWYLRDILKKHRDDYHCMMED
jgi:hypothetical protein